MKYIYNPYILSLFCPINSFKLEYGFKTLVLELKMVVFLIISNPYIGLLVIKSSPQFNIRISSVSIGIIRKIFEFQLY